MSATPINVQLHGFCDPSIEAYADVVYLRAVYPDKSVTVSMLASKTRVSPQKPQTMRRLELLLVVRLVTTIRDCLSLLKPMETLLWTDSTVVLCWLQSHKPCKQYVSSCINEICKLTSKDSWHHCSGALNAADISSRGMKGTELVCNCVWWEGSQFLKLGEMEWPCTDVIDVSEEAQAEFMKDPPEIAFTLAASSSVSNSFNHARVSSVIGCAQFGSLHRLLTVTAYLLRHCWSCVHGAVQCQKSLVEEITKAEKHWIRCIQYESFQDTYRPTDHQNPASLTSLDCLLIKIKL